MAYYKLRDRAQKHSDGYKSGMRWGGWVQHKPFPSFLLTPLPLLQIRCNIQSVHNNVSIFLQHLLLRKLRLLQRDSLGRFALEHPAFRYVPWMLTTRTGHPKPLVPRVLFAVRCAGGTGGTFLSEHNFVLLLSLSFARIVGRCASHNPFLHRPVLPRSI